MHNNILIARLDVLRFFFYVYFVTTTCKLSFLALIFKRNIATNSITAYLTAWWGLVETRCPVTQTTHTNQRPNATPNFNSE